MSRLGSIHLQFMNVRVNVKDRWIIVFKKMRMHRIIFRRFIVIVVVIDVMNVGSKGRSNSVGTITNEMTLGGLRKLGLIEDLTRRNDQVAVSNIVGHWSSLSDFEMKICLDGSEFPNLRNSLHEQCTLHFIGVMIGHRSESFIFSNLVLEIHDEADMSTTPRSRFKLEGR